ncbi:DUF4961 domain-containing protein [Chitinophaga arvensicola]|uniref:DUF4961 domain-containing protein n=1 Tax=Chitinophaga arvensicola TaxID=29529 RepID=A0A1I0SAS6_9BACT|nr:DUF4961 domain-containing protein [Chitinophaga arvensicola]SEW53750.1 protein of unknown function [Chitinophaga arvensicola]
MKNYTYGIILFLLLLAGCVFLDGVDQPSSAKAGEEMTITMHNRLDVADGGRSNVRLIIGFLAPKSWAAAASAKITYTTTSYGNGKMVPVPASVNAGGGLTWPAALKNRFGMGGNYMTDDLEWVVFWTEQAYNVPQGVKDKIDVTMVIKPGPENIQFKTGYFLGTSSEGLSDVFGANNVYKCQFKDCFSITGGQGDVIDFCNPQLSAITPGVATDNDFLTLSFDPEVVPTALNGVGNIYFCAKGYTNDGQVLDACVQTDDSKLKSYTGKKSAITIWPRAYFKMQDGQTLTKIEYFFTDATGTVKVGFGNTSAPFVYTFKCQ